MGRENIRDYVMGLIEEITDIPVEQMKEESLLMDDVELSSLEIMTMMSDLEEEYDVVIREKDIRDFATIGDIINYICISKSV